MIRALTIGTFDTPHLGHAFLFKECERYADEVVVGINSDDFVTSYKENKPLFTYEQRSRIVSSLGYVVVENCSAGRECIEQVKPNLLVVGSDWARKDYYKQIDVDQDFMDDNRISVLYIPLIKNISSTIIKGLANG